MIETATAPTAGIMAIGTLRRSRDMGSCLAGRPDAVMTAPAGTGYHRMIEVNPGPASCQMTYDAISAGLDMLCMLARRDQTIVAFDTRPGHTGVIESSIGKAAFRMAVVAKPHGPDMRRRFTHGSDTIVATLAGLWCPLELATQVTVGTIQPLVCTGKRIPRLEMIEIRCCAIGRHRWPGPAQKNHNQPSG